MENKHKETYKAIQKIKEKTSILKVNHSDTLEMKTYLRNLNMQLKALLINDWAEERVSEIENCSLELTQTTVKTKAEFYKMENVWKIWDYVKQPTTCMNFGHSWDRRIKNKQPRIHLWRNNSRNIF